MNRFSDIARAFKITKHEAYREILTRSNVINRILIESEHSVFEKISEEIYKTKENLLSDEFIGSIIDIHSNIPIEKNPYIYYLYNDRVLIYIGQTNNLLQRIAAHQDDKEFDGISFMEVDRRIMVMVEELNIYYYQPILNIVGKSHLEFYKLILKNCDFD